MSLLAAAPGAARASRQRAGPSHQRLTLVQISAQRKRFLWDRGCIQRLLLGCLGGVKGYCGVFRVFFIFRGILSQKQLWMS